MSITGKVIDIVLHVDKYLNIIVQNYGIATYFILFLIIFLETGVVVTPFLPGDSLIFVAGTIAAKNLLNVYVLFILISIAAILGDTLNYWIGNYFGDKISNSKWVKKKYLDRTNRFYEKHGGKTIILARFIPIIRTFAPFVAGIGKMSYSRFVSFNVVGGIAWVGIFLFGGYFFGNIPFVQDNLALVILVIILASFVPPLFEYLRQKLKIKDRRDAKGNLSLQQE